ncbi:MAG: hypothetical protein AB7K08_02410 [Microbacteriaceae bacterium]
MTDSRMAAGSLGVLSGALAAIAVAVGTAEVGAIAGGIAFGPGGPLGVVDPRLAVIAAIVTALVVLAFSAVSLALPLGARSAFWCAFAVAVAAAIAVSVPLGSFGAVPVRTDAVTWTAAQLARSPLAAAMAIASIGLAARGRSGD